MTWQIGLSNLLSNWEIVVEKVSYNLFQWLIQATKLTGKRSNIRTYNLKDWYWYVFFRSKCYMSKIKRYKDAHFYQRGENHVCRTWRLKCMGVGNKKRVQIGEHWKTHQIVAIMGEHFAIFKSDDFIVGDWADIVALRWPGFLLETSALPSVICYMVDYAIYVIVSVIWISV